MTGTATACLSAVVTRVTGVTRLRAKCLCGGVRALFYKCVTTRHPCHSRPTPPARVCAFRLCIWPDPRARQQQAAWDVVAGARARQAHGETAPGRSAVDDVAQPPVSRILDTRRRVCAVFALADKRLSRSGFRARVGHVVPSLCRVWVG